MSVSDEAVASVAPEQGGDVAQELAYRLRQQQLTAEFGHFALKTHAMDGLLGEATRACAQGLQVKLCKVMQYLPDEDQFLLRAGVGWKPGFVGQARAGADIGSPAGYAFQTGQPVISNNLQAEARFRMPTILVEHGVKRAINVLIQGNEGHRFGVLEVDSTSEGRFAEADLTFMQGFAALLGVAIERQAAEAALRLNEVKLKDALEHQEVLTREISHRVKNSLSIVASLLAMQGRMTGDATVKQALGDARERVMTIAEVHDRLWRTDEVHTLDLAEFLGDLCERLSASGPGHELTCRIAPNTRVATDEAVPLGLLANELVTNAFKYAYPHGAGTIELSVQPDDRGHLCFEIRDHGVGLPASFAGANTRSLGVKMITILSRQLGGRIEWRNADPGTRFTMSFRPQEHLSRD